MNGTGDFRAALPSQWTLRTGTQHQLDFFTAFQPSAVFTTLHYSREASPERTRFLQAQNYELIVESLLSKTCASASALDSIA
jgi:hypothetical protein